MNARASALIAVALAGASCQLVYGLDDFHADTSETASSSSRGASSASSASSASTQATGSTGHTGSGGHAGMGGGGEGGSGEGGSACGDPCTSGPPTGWRGPYAVRHEDATIAATPCDEGDTVVLMGDPVPLTCSACGCQETEAHCQGPTLDSFAVNGCIGHTDTSNSGCVFAISARASGSAKLIGGCSATGGERSGGFATRHTLCALPPSSCDAPCAPPAGSDLCIERDGEATCPTGWDTRTVVNERAQDTFVCNACTCETRLVCADAWTAQTGFVDCGATGTVLATNTCSDSTWFFYPDAPTGPTACTSKGAGSTGNYTPVAAHTICCR